MKKRNVVFGKENESSHDINIAILDVLNNFLLENLVSLDFPFSWSSDKGG